MKSKNIRVPFELIDKIEKRSPGIPPGKVLFEIVKDYEVLEEYATSVDPASKASVSEIIIGYYHNLDMNRAEVQKTINEVKIMIQGMQLQQKYLKKEK